MKITYINKNATFEYIEVVHFLDNSRTRQFDQVIRNSPRLIVQRL